MTSYKYSYFDMYILARAETNELYITFGYRIEAMKGLRLSKSIRTPKRRWQVPFHQPLLAEKEIRACAKALRKGNIAGDGPICSKVEARLRHTLGASHVLLTTSGTHALELALMAAEIKPGDEVICPSFTFVSTANAILRQGAKPVFAEISEDTLNINPEDIKRKITSKTRAILPVHYAGISCDMDSIMTIAKQNRLRVIEDAAQSYGSKHRVRALGLIGDIGCLSFHQTKNIICGEGGALITSNHTIARKAEIMREKGTDRSAFVRGEVSHYSWKAVGSSYVMSDLLAAVLLEQLPRANNIRKAQGEIYRIYKEGLSELESKCIIQLPSIPAYCTPNWHIFFFLLSPKLQGRRQEVLRELAKRGIEATFHFIPLHSSPYGRKLQRKRLDLPVTDSVGKRIIRLPLYPKLSKSSAHRIVSEVRSVLTSL